MYYYLKGVIDVFFKIVYRGSKMYLKIPKRPYLFLSSIKFFTSTRIAPGSLNVSRTLGDIETKQKKYGGLPGMISSEPDIKTFEKENYEILLLASDGLFEAFTNLEVQKLYYRIAHL